MGGLKSALSKGDSSGRKGKRSLTLDLTSDFQESEIAEEVEEQWGRVDLIEEVSFGVAITWLFQTTVIGLFIIHSLTDHDAMDLETFEARCVYPDILGPVYERVALTVLSNALLIQVMGPLRLFPQRQPTSLGSVTISAEAKAVVSQCTAVVILALFIASAALSLAFGARAAWLTGSPLCGAAIIANSSLPVKCCQIIGLEILRKITAKWEALHQCCQDDLACGYRLAALALINSWTPGRPHSPSGTPMNRVGSQRGWVVNAFRTSANIAFRFLIFGPMGITLLLPYALLYIPANLLLECVLFPLSALVSWLGVEVLLFRAASGDRGAQVEKGLLSERALFLEDVMLQEAILVKMDPPVPISCGSCSHACTDYIITDTYAANCRFYRATGSPRLAWYWFTFCTLAGTVVLPLAVSTTSRFYILVSQVHGSWYEVFGAYYEAILITCREHARSAAATAGGPSIDAGGDAVLNALRHVWAALDKANRLL